MEFVKYQGTGNDFVILNGLENYPENLDVKTICDRRFGVGADGLMILKKNPLFDFEMVYYNSDGNLSSMCGNGGRCLAHFAIGLGLGRDGRLNFVAVDGPHEAFVQNEMVDLEMRDVKHWEKRSDNVFVLNTGSPHYVAFMEDDLSQLDLITFSKNIRYNEEFAKAGINVNAVRATGPDSIEIRTYERGVEDETLSCGTGVTAAALAYQLKKNQPIANVKVQTKGGPLSVHSLKAKDSFSDIVLSGPAVEVFRGNL
jgi:diaminopimelate epimerase